MTFAIRQRDGIALKFKVSCRRRIEHRDGGFKAHECIVRLETIGKSRCRWIENQQGTVCWNRTFQPVLTICPVRTGVPLPVQRLTQHMQSDIVAVTPHVSDHCVVTRPEEIGNHRTFRQPRKCAGNWIGAVVADHDHLGADRRYETKIGVVNGGEFSCQFYCAGDTDLGILLIIVPGCGAEDRYVQRAPGLHVEIPGSQHG